MRLRRRYIPKRFRVFGFVLFQEIHDCDYTDAPAIFTEPVMHIREMRNISRRNID